MAIETLLLFILIALSSFMAWKLRLLSLSGAFAAFVVGCAIVLGFGLEGLIILGLFFISSSIFSKYKKSRKSFLKDVHEKGSVRDWVQVCANGGIAAISGFVAYFYSDPIFTLAFAISLASANADTWASELGSLSKRPPLSIRGGTRVTVGTSGAVSLLGTVAGFFGAMLIAASATLLLQLEIKTFMFILIFGFGGMLIDTILGAYFQAEYRCLHCSLIIEKPSHCGRKAILIKGVNWLRNDAVNFLSCLIAVILGMVLYILV